MRAAVVSSQAAISSNRLDPEFHLLAQEHKVASDALSQRFSESEARDKLAVLPTPFLEPLLPLCTGAYRRNLDEAVVRRQARLEPFLALALIEAFLPKMEARIAAKQQALAVQSAEIASLRGDLAGPTARRKAAP